RDPDVLRFNHQRHFASDIPPLNGQKLDCNYRHRPQPAGRFYQRISFAANCQACHSLQFDWRNPEMRIPHGNVDLVRTFLRSLPAPSADYARSNKGMPEREVTASVTQKPLDCNLCHQARQSRETSDVLMPAKANCTICHSPQGKIVAECITCHSYHAPIAAQTVAESTKSVKQMLLDAK